MIDEFENEMLKKELNIPKWQRKANFNSMIIKDYLNGGNVEKICENYCISSKTLYQILEKQKISKRQGSADRVSLEINQYVKMVEVMRKFLSWEQIKKETGIAKQYFQQVKNKIKQMELSE